MTLTEESIFEGGSVFIVLPVYELGQLSVRDEEEGEDRMNSSSSRTHDFTQHGESRSLPGTADAEEEELEEMEMERLFGVDDDGSIANVPVLDENEESDWSLFTSTLSTMLAHSLNFKLKLLSPLSLIGISALSLSAASQSGSPTLSSPSLSSFSAFSSSAPLSSSSASGSVPLPGPTPAPGVYNSSQTPKDLPWNTYNYCNAPHVNAATYTKPSQAANGEAELVYVNVMIRHHKRTPDNLYPTEGTLGPQGAGVFWSADNFRLMNYGYGGFPTHHEMINPHATDFDLGNGAQTHPFASLMWAGYIDQGTLTEGGFQDAIKHGQDFFSVYHNQLSFLPNPPFTEQDIWMRTSDADRTFQVASALMAGMGMDPALDPSKTWRVWTQPTNIDSLVPSYPCSAADNLRNAYQSVPAWTDHLNANQDLMDRLGNMLGTAGMSAWTSWYDHFFDTFTSRTCNAHPLPCNVTTNECVSQADAERVFALGDYEYNYIWNTADGANEYTALTFGVMFAELASNFRSFVSGSETTKMRFYVGHDGSMIRLQSGLGFGNTQSLRWPALGSEIVMEVWKTKSKSSSSSNSNSSNLFVRVVFEGTSFPGGQLAWMPIEDFITLLESNVPDEIFAKCMGTVPL